MQAIDVAAGLPLLLQRPAHEITLAPVSHDFQARVGRPEVPEEDGCIPCVVVLTRTADREIDKLSLHLAADGIPMLRLDIDRCNDQDVCWDLERGALVMTERSFRPRACWQRYFAPPALPVVGDALVDAYARDQWLWWAPTLLAPPARTVNPDAGPGRMAQLAQARTVGLRTPRTVVSTSLAAAARRITGRGDLLVKSLGEHFVEPEPGRLTGLAPRRIGRGEAMSHTALEPAPVVVQEFLACKRELRIYAVAGELFTFAVDRPTPEALWTQPERLRACAVDTPQALAEPLMKLAFGWGLEVAAFDLLDTPDGLVFLEVNAACDWLWCESLARETMVSDAVHRLVASLFDTQETSAPGVAAG